MIEDGLLAAIDAAQRTGRVTRDAISAAIDTLERARTDRIGGMTVADVVDAMIERGGPEIRRATAAAWSDFERAVMLLRAEVARELVDEHGITFSEIARRWSVSRQVVAKLYRQATTNRPLYADGPSESPKS